MKIPFTVEQFLGVFKEYNLTVYPIQVIFNIIALLCVFLILSNKNSSKFIFFYLGFLWLWMGIIYHLFFFTAINNAAYVFGVIFIFQGIFFFYYALRQEIKFKLTSGIRSYTSIALLLYSLIIYPLLGYAWGHGYPDSPTFGLPCPTTIYSFALLLLINGKIPVKLTAIPLIWSAIGFTAAFSLGIYEDIGLLAAGLVTLLFLILKEPDRI
ncbi:MAG: hypothetical protein UZ05_CHB002000491 [Chlorobi bacterium OLB5]|nr:MAG: hypothetical protein UZ05_CHB002000491 [Chlorobi bacterium OLB5]